VLSWLEAMRHRAGKPRDAILWPRYERQLNHLIAAFVAGAVVGIASLVAGAMLGIALGGKGGAGIASHAPAEAQLPDTGQEPASLSHSPAGIAVAPPPDRLAASRPALVPPEGAAALVASAPPRDFVPAPGEPGLLYEESLIEPDAAAVSSPPRGADGERKPALIGKLASLTFRPIPGPTPLWLKNALPMPDPRGRPMIAVVIDDVGLDRRRGERALRLPGAVTLSLLPYAPEVAQQAVAARALGHEIMLHMPMEPESPRIDPGPHALRIADTASQILHELDWGLAQFGGYVAVNNHMGSRFTRDPEGMRVVLDAIKERGLFFLDSRTTGASVGARLARELGLPHLERDVFLDNIDTLEEVTARLAEAERVARRDGYAIAIGHPHDATLDALERWLPQAQARGLALVPISAVMRVRLAAEQQEVPLQQAGG